jgi:hypothetical protein
MARLSVFCLECEKMMELPSAESSLCVTPDIEAGRCRSQGHLLTAIAVLDTAREIPKYTAIQIS